MKVLLISFIFLIVLSGCTTSSSIPNSASVTAEDQINILNQKNIEDLSEQDLKLLINYNRYQAHLGRIMSVNNYYQNNAIIYELELTHRIIGGR